MPRKQPLQRNRTIRIHGAEQIFIGRIGKENDATLVRHIARVRQGIQRIASGFMGARDILAERSEEHTSELQSLMRISYAVFCLKNKKTTSTHTRCNDIRTTKRKPEKR